MGRLMGIEPTSAWFTARCVNHFATIAIKNLKKNINSLNPLNFYSTTKGSKAISLDLLIAVASILWYFAQVPVTRRGIILPFAEKQIFLANQHLYNLYELILFLVKKTNFFLRSLFFKSHYYFPFLKW